MLTRGDWQVPYSNGLPAPSHLAASDRLLDWSIAASFKVFGVADWSARLPIAICLGAIALMAFLFGRRMFTWNGAGLYAALIVLMWPGTFLASRHLTPAPLLCAETAVLAFALWYLLVVKPVPVWTATVAVAITCALSLLTGNYPALSLSIAITATCWAARRKPLTATQLARWVLIEWTVCALLFANFPGSPPWSPFPWLGLTLPLALFLGGWLANQEVVDDRGARRLAYVIFSVGIIASAFLIFFAVQGPLGFSLFTPSELLSSGPGRIPFIILASALITGVTGNLVYRLHHNLRIANCFLAGMLGGMTVAIQAGLVIASPYSSSEILADAIRPELESTDVIVVDGEYTEASSFAFYLEHPVVFALQSESTPVPPKNTVAIEPLWTSNTRVYLWTRIDRPFPVPGQSYVIASSGGKEVLSNQPNSGGASF